MYDFFHRLTASLYDNDRGLFDFAQEKTRATDTRNTHEKANATYVRWANFNKFFHMLTASFISMFLIFADFFLRKNKTL